MTLPIRVRCTDEHGEVVIVDLSKGWLWQQQTVNNQRYTALFPPDVSTVHVDDPRGAREVVMPRGQLVRQTPDELKALELEAYKQALREEMRIRRELEAEQPLKTLKTRPDGSSVAADA
ncbi:hypothetical protein [Methyloceanibacter caenitepidi]|uniref:Uncharacterized protein n=1 Tax=Methyloceanibacter caenitepidi TaxID=1384459 RepID=A0A0A8K710_9HYPH|nr:hypothetical protein [Methyloceanibacter caenitepidi]BAQ18297.1 hypothetical protein GL4_2864 [Methyloceanibacter caenitepidi]